MRNLILIAVASVAACFAQTVNPPFSGGGGATINSYTTAGLPSSGVSAGTLAIVTDASTAGLCNSGGGTNLSLCRWSGAAWTTVGGSGGSGTVINTYTVSTLPVAPANATIALVTDASPAGSCSVGGGTGHSVCQYSTTATAWQPIGAVIDGSAITTGTVNAARIPAALPGTTSINGTTIPSASTLMTTATALSSTQMPALTGDTTSTAGSTTTTTGKVNGVAYPSAPATNKVPVVTAANTVTYEAVPNTALANASSTVNGTSCTLGSTCTVTAAPSGSASGDLSGSYPSPTVAKINGVLLSGLATGILKNTTTTGAPSIATAGTDYVGLASSNAYTSGTQDFTNAAHFLAKNGLASAKPATCTVGEFYFATDATAGQNWYFCTSPSVWTQQLNSGSAGGSPAGPTGAVQTNGGSGLFGDSGCTAATGTMTCAGYTTNATTPGADNLVAGTGSIPALPSNSAGFAAPVSGGTSYLFKLPATATAGVLTAATPATGDGVNESALSFTSLPAGTLAGTIASGTAALGTSAIASGACATAVTVTATGVATTDSIAWTPNADITAVTGYAPVTTGGLAIYPYPTAGNVNFKVCNPTSSSVTPGAVTLNWRVGR